MPEHSAFYLLLLSTAMRCRIFVYAQGLVWYGMASWYVSVCLFSIFHSHDFHCFSYTMLRLLLSQPEQRCDGITHILPSGTRK